MLNSWFLDTFLLWMLYVLKVLSLGMLYCYIHQDILNINLVPVYFSKNSYSLFDVLVFLKTLSLGMQCLCSSQDTHNRNVMSVPRGTVTRNEIRSIYQLTAARNRVFVSLGTLLLRMLCLCICWGTLNWNVSFTYVSVQSYYECGVCVFLMAVSVWKLCLCQTLWLCFCVSRCCLTRNALFVCFSRQFHYELNVLH
jgi:hypothetical protein